LLDRERHLVDGFEFAKFHGNFLHLDGIVGTESGFTDATFFLVKTAFGLFVHVICCLFDLRLATFPTAAEAKARML